MGQSGITRRQVLAGMTAWGGALTLAGCAHVAAPPPTQGAVRELEALAWRLLREDPQQATALGVDTGENRALRARLNARSPAGMERVVQVLRQGLGVLDRLDPSAIDAATRLDIAVVRSAFRLALDGFALPYGDVSVGGWRNTPYVVIQNAGAYLDTPRFLDADHPVRDEQDAEAWLARLGDMPGQIDGETARISQAAAMGLIPPAFLLDKTIAQMRQTIASARQGGDLVRSLTRRTEDIPGDWDRRAREVVTASVVPALERQLEELLVQRGRATMDAGMWARPHGDEYYAWALRAATTTPMTPAEIHELGKQELAELQGRMDPILRSLGHATGTVGERMTALGRDRQFRFGADDAGRAAIIGLMQSKFDFIRARLPLAFRRLAPGRLEIRRLPLAEEAGAPNAYGGPGSIDGSIPGKVWLNLGDTSRHTRFSVPTLGFHEGIPGHVWQGEYAQQLPLIRTLLSFNAYSEGWALYAEQLGDELGAYEHDPAGRLGYLQSLAFRACRMVVDTGLHAMKWSREQAIDWFAATNGSPRAEVEPEVDRYCSWPGQACGYKLGHSEILRLRAKAQAALGPRYDLRDFNQAVVDGGNVPLDVLAQTVERYIAGAG